MTNRKKKWYGGRIRFADNEPWGPFTFYPTRKERDKDSAISRIIGGVRTHSIEHSFPIDVDPRDLEEEEIRRALGLDTTANEGGKT